jgi:hypothetical protein
MDSNTIHKSRLFDIGAGMGVSLENSIRIVNARSLSLLKRAKEDFRDFIDSSTPSIYPIDISKDVVEPLYSKYEISIDKGTFKNKIVKALEEATSTITTVELQNKITAAINKNRETITFLESRKSSHIEYRNAFYTMGNDIAAIFSARVNLIITDPENMGLSGKMVFVGKSFTGLKSKINETINSILRANTADTKAYYGSVRAAGHTSVSLGNDTYGTNTPLIQETLFRLEASKSGLIDPVSFSNDFVKKVPLFLNNSITFSENFTPTAKTLLNIGFTFIVPMDTALNSASGSVELKAIKDLVNNTVMPGIADAMKNRLSWLKSKIGNIQGSPTAKEYTLKNLENAFKNKKLESRVYSETKKSKHLLEILIPDIKAIGVKLNKKVAPGRVYSSVVPVMPTAESFSLAGLQQLINDNLQNVISANMGNGSNRNILNYQTGRFAASASVERLSQSRAGMITAFYSYMKYPYQTFEPGFVQGSPQTRDPKLLIAKSIREIAATKVGNRMRAVLI